MVDSSNYHIAQIETRLGRSGRHDSFNMARLRLVMLVIVFGAATAATAASIQPYPTVQPGVTVVATLD